MVPKRNDGFFKPFPVISHNRLGYFFFFTGGCADNRYGKKTSRSKKIFFIQ
jgi:hypothetical protein